MITPEVTGSVEYIVPFVTGVTSLVKKLGIKGDWLILVCCVTGGLATYLSTYQPQLWSSAPMIIAGITAIASGNVSLLTDFVTKLTTPQK